MNTQMCSDEYTNDNQFDVLKAENVFVSNNRNMKLWIINRISITLRSAQSWWFNCMRVYWTKIIAWNEYQSIIMSVIKWTWNDKMIRIANIVLIPKHRADALFCFVLMCISLYCAVLRFGLRAHLVSCKSETRS